MKKILKILTVFLIVVSGIFCDVKAQTTGSSDYLSLKSGVFIKVMVLEEFSTLTSDIEDTVKFINTQDMYIYETNVVPEGTIFYGEIEDLLEPVSGRDGALKINIYKMITPDKKVYKIKGHIYSENENYIGGKKTANMYYHKVPHYSSKLKPMLQAAPLNVYEMVQHTVVKPGAELFVILEEDVILK